jgi:hypothetical protein
MNGECVPISSPDARNPIAELQPALAAITNAGVRVLPATGQAIEDLMRPDQDEGYDRVRLGSSADGVLDRIEDSVVSYVEVAPRHRTQDHVFRHFLDGSARTYYIGNIVEGHRQSPVHVAQIGAGAVSRDDRGRIKTGPLRHRFLLGLDFKQLSEHLLAAVTEALAPTDGRFELLDLMERDPETDGVEAGKEPRSRAAHKANWQMRMLEIEMARRLKVGPDEWLVLDGGLGKEYLVNPPASGQFAGVVKSTYKNLSFSLGSGRERREVNLYELLAGLHRGYRSAAYEILDGKAATWFVRIRGPEGLEFPLMGVLRVEIPLPNGGPVSSELLNRLSGALLEERSCTPYGADPRWHSHLYPIWLAERAIKGRFVSSEILKASLRWPTLSSNGSRTR